MAPFAQERPCIHVTLFPGTDPSLYQWVQIGAEEEGVPCRLVQEEAPDLIALAYAAAQSSRFNIGVGVADSEVVLHEIHMPPEQPVLVFKFTGQADYFCRLMGSNAARMIVRKPFRFDDEPAPFENGNNEQVVAPQAIPMADKLEETAPGPITDPVLIAKIVAVIIRKLEERGIR